MNNVIKADRVKLDEYYLCHYEEKTDDSRQEEKKKDSDVERLLQHAQDNYKMIIDEAEKLKIQILKEAEKEADDKRKEAYNKGYEEGKREGFEEGKNNGYIDGFNRAQQIIKDANELKKMVELERERQLKHLEQDIIQLVATCVKRIVGDIDFQDEFTGIVREAIRKLNVRDKFVVRVSEEDYGKLQGKEDVIPENGELIADSYLKHGEILIDMPNGVIDCGVITQIKNMEGVLKDILLNE